MSYADNYPDCMWTDFDVLENFMKDCLMKLGVPKDDAAIVADVLITADKQGIDSHGIGRFKLIYTNRIEQGILNPETDIEIVKETETTAVLDGHNGMGHVISQKAMQIAIDKAKKTGMGMTAVRNSTHYGIAGYYPLMACDNNMIGITGTNARPSIAPTFGVENMLGTNPLTIGFPTDEDFPFILDCATSVAQRGKIEAYDRAGKKLPEGWVVGRDGKTKVDASQVLVDLVKGNASLVPIGGIGEETAGYKGYGYATVVEVLSAALAGGKFMKDLNGIDENGKKIPFPLGHFFIAINIESFIDPSIFKSIAGSIMRQLRNSELAPGEKKIYTAGEKEWLAWQFRKDHGCPVPPALQKQFVELNERLNVGYTFPWEK